MSRLLLAVVTFLPLPPLLAQGPAGNAPASAPAASAPADWQSKFTFRQLGPANMGGRITDFAVCESDPNTFWVATAAAGLLKTTNNGMTFEHQFDKQAVASVGAVAVAATDPNLVWVGTGEENPRNSVSWGDGVYKSTDGGKSWQHMGLRESFQISDIVIHPKDPNVVYVGALGRLWGPNEERGLYKTVDGGAHWERVLYVDDKTGVIDIAVHPGDPNTLLVATYERERDLFCSNDPSKKWGKGSALHRTSDGGKTFTKVTQGLPTGILGRIGLDWYRKDPNVVYAIVESEAIGKAGKDVGFTGLRGEDAETGARLTQITPEGPAAKAGLETGDIVLSVGEQTVLNFRQLEEQLARFAPGESAQLEVARKGESRKVTLALSERPAPRARGRGAAGGNESESGEAAERPAGPPAGFAGGRGGGDPERPFEANLGGQRSNVAHLQGKQGHEHGGVYRSADAGVTWTRVNSINPRPMYFSKVRIDPSDETYQWVLGVSLARSKDKGATFSDDGGRGVHADQHAMWIDPRDGRHVLVGCDGGVYVTYDRGDTWDHLNHVALGQFYHAAVSSRRDYWVFGGLQDNGTWGAPHRGVHASGTLNEDWLRVGSGDGFVVAVDPDDPDQIYYESQNGGTGRTNLRTMESGRIRPQAERGVTYRFNWKTPFLLSAHNSRIYYNAGNHVFRSLNKGDDLKPISPQISRTDRGSATALSESPRDSEVLYVGTDDGALWGTRNGGKEWSNLWVIEKEPATDPAGIGSGGPRVAESTAEEGKPLGALVTKPCYVASLEASRFKPGRVYMALDAHRSDDDLAYPMVSEDFGKTWTLLRGNLPRGSSRALREDRVNENLLYLGTEFGFYVSHDRGASWYRLHNNLPTVAVHDIAQHQSCGDIVLATHGRSLWALDVTTLRQMTPAAIAAPALLYDPADVVVWRRKHPRGQTGGPRFVGDNPDSQAHLYYHLAQDAQSLTLRVEDGAGETMMSFDDAPKTAGLQRVSWDLRRARPRDAQAGNAPADPAAAGRRGGRGGAGGPPGAGGAGGGGFGGRGRGMASAAPGVYRVILEVDGKRMVQTFEVQSDPNFVGIPAPANPFFGGDDEDGR